MRNHDKLFSVMKIKLLIFDIVFHTYGLNMSSFTSTGPSHWPLTANHELLISSILEIDNGCTLKMMALCRFQIQRNMAPSMSKVLWFLFAVVFNLSIFVRLPVHNSCQKISKRYKQQTQKSICSENSHHGNEESHLYNHTPNTHTLCSCFFVHNVLKTNEEKHFANFETL